MQIQTASAQLKHIQEELERIYQSTNLIHVSILNKRNKVVEAPSKILGIYSRFLCVESKVNAYVEKFTINYIDIMTGNIIIKEL
ncbi:MAG: hypothetical protein K2N64_02040 [Anaeroplasmataceae bacterium]|nr:hypothetical protein [Anaeroplasmataceae bacterium]